MTTSIFLLLSIKCMISRNSRPLGFVAAAAMLVLLLGAPLSRADTVASLLGNFTINQYSGLSLSPGSLNVHFAVVYGQLPALKELHIADTDGDGVTSQVERDSYVGSLAPGFAQALELTVDGVRVPLRATRWTSSLPTEQGGFSLRVDVDFTAPMPVGNAARPHSIRFSNQNYSGRIGWHEIVVSSNDGLVIFDSDAYSTSATQGLSEALQSLPASGPLDERSVDLSFGTVLPAGSVAQRPRPLDLPPIKAQSANTASPAIGALENAWIAKKTKQLVEAISAPKLDPRVALWTLLAALALGAVHALSPGHGKTIVGAYLIGSRGTPRHAAFLGITVTVTHTVGVFAIGFATLYASRFIMPEKLFPILSMVSALIVLAMGLVLLVQRAKAARHVRAAEVSDGELRFFPVTAPTGTAGATRGIAFAHAHVGDYGQLHSHPDGTMHSHGGGPVHSHLPPGARGERVTWKSLLALGISGGLVPCPSAMVLLLAAIAFNKTAYGMLLVLAFSAGLAMTLTVVGLVFLHARNRFGARSSSSRWPKLLPVLSAATVTLLGVALCFSALRALG